MKNILKNIKKTAGFTLMELVITTSVMGTLAAVAVPKYSEVNENSKNIKTNANIDNLLGGAQNFYNERVQAEGHGRFPEQLSGTTGDHQRDVGTISITSDGVVTASEGVVIFAAGSEWFDIYSEGFRSPYDSIYLVAIIGGTAGVDATAPVIVVWDDLNGDGDLDYPDSDGTGGEPYRILIP